MQERPCAAVCAGSRGQPLASSEATGFERSPILPTIRHDVAQLRSGVSHPSAGQHNPT
jgi:hypothetical protein